MHGQGLFVNLQQDMALLGNCKLLFEPPVCMQSTDAAMQWQEECTYLQHAQSVPSTGHSLVLCVAVPPNMCCIGPCTGIHGHAAAVQNMVMDV